MGADFRRRGREMYPKEFRFGGGAAAGIVGYAFFLCFGLVGVGGLISDYVAGRPPAWGWGIGLIAISVLLCTYLTLFRKNGRLFVYADRLEWTDFLGNLTIAKNADIDTAYFVGTQGYYRLRTRSGTSFTFSKSLPGFEELLIELRERIEPERRDF